MIELETYHEDKWIKIKFEIFDKKIDKFGKKWLYLRNKELNRCVMIKR